MPWQLLMLVQNGLAAIFTLQSRDIAKKYKYQAIQFNLLVFVVIFLTGIAAMLVLGFHDFHFSDLTGNIPFFLFAGVCFALTNIIQFKVMEYVDAAIASLLSTLNIIAAVVVSTVVIEEGLTSLQGLGAVFVLASIYLILALNVSPKKHQKIHAALLLSLLASLFFALSTTTEKYLIDRMSLQSYFVFGWGFQLLGVIGTAFILLNRRKVLQSFRNTIFVRKSLAAGVTRALAGGAFIFSLRLADNLSIVTVFSGLKVVFVALLGYAFLKERQQLARKLEAAILASIGIALLLWR